ncbi:MAG: CDP-diacylglycerol--glycerol-3-phosphate 3-phosphatidyltransferase [Christensenellaceae bacterium]|jgi:CDP-diacylglycerol--glycerol-3-phosphate 3-phosphatidyltransferase|nr:CDP-diacylglycerol--glycerol-3-phosphate 3-phosphatidyltransferase [Christensenellaceae bacterium]
MTIANKLTLLRVGMIPLFVLSFYLCGDLFFVPALLFSLAAFTDYLDGCLARSRGEVTTFGKFMDPIADKLLVAAAFVLLVSDGRLPAWICVVFLGREFLISGFRLVAAGENMVIAASPLGKVKTVTQLVAAILLLLWNWPFSLIHLPMDQIAVWGALIFTVWSGVEYILKNKGLLSARKG